MACAAGAVSWVCFFSCNLDFIPARAPASNWPLSKQLQWGDKGERALKRLLPASCSLSPQDICQHPRGRAADLGKAGTIPPAKPQSHHSTVFKMAREPQIKSRRLVSRSNLCFLSPDVAISQQDRYSFMEGQIFLSIFPSFLASLLFPATFLLI